MQLFEFTCFIRMSQGFLENEIQNFSLEKIEKLPKSNRENNSEMLCSGQTSPQNDRIKMLRLARQT